MQDDHITPAQVYHLQQIIPISNSSKKYLILSIRLPQGGFIFSPSLLQMCYHPTKNTLLKLKSHFLID